MNKKNKELENSIEKRNDQVENKHRLDELVNAVERHTRTERHLEQHSDIASPEQIEHAKEIQQKREREIENLKETIAYGEHPAGDELENLEKNYSYSQGYLEHNRDHMSTEAIENLKEKQENRKEKMDELKFR